MTGVWRVIFVLGLVFSAQSLTAQLERAAPVAESITPEALGLSIAPPPALPEGRLRLPDEATLQALVTNVALPAVAAAAAATQAEFDPIRPYIPPEILAGLRPKSSLDVIRQRMEGTRPPTRRTRATPDPVPVDPETDPLPDVLVPDTSFETAPVIEGDQSALSVAPVRSAEPGPDLTELRAALQDTRPELRSLALVSSQTAVVPSLRPQIRRAVLPAPAGICGRSDIIGEVIGRVPGRGSCGIERAVRVSNVAGVALSTDATINCETAIALRDWVHSGVKPAFRDVGERVVSLRVAASYVCRTCNHQRGARLSEHSFGNAIDISAFRTESGRVITVRDGWGRRNDGRTLRRIHSAACGPFGTVLGPESDRFHLAHFHMDIARYSGGPYCR